MLTSFRILFGGLCLLKAVSTTAPVALERGGPVGITFTSDAAVALPAGFVMGVAALALVAGYRTRLAASGVAAAAPVFALGLDRYNHHLYLMFVISLIVAIDRDVLTLLKIQLSIVYGYGALAKVNEGFLSGTALYGSMVKRPVWENLISYTPPAWVLISLSLAVVVTEAFLAAAFWFKPTRMLAAVVGVGLHVCMVVLLSPGPALMIDLMIYAGLMVALYLPFFSPRRLPTTQGVSP